MFVALSRVRVWGVPPSSTGGRQTRPVDREERVKYYEEVMEMLEAFDLTGSFRAAGELAGCSHHTVAHWVALGDQRLLPGPLEVVERTKLIDPFLPKIEE
jgi:hypothetical protein